VRWQVLVAATVLALQASASAQPGRTTTQTKGERGDFWMEVIEPNGQEVTTILEKVNRLMKAPDDALMSEQDHAVEQRARFFRDAYNLLRYARKLSPENVEVLSKLGRSADEIGKTAEAIEALEACVRVVGPEKAGAGVTGMLGAIYLRLEKYDDAVRWLKHAQGPLTPDSAPALVHLANALAARGETIPAIDTLSNVIPQQSFGGFEGQVALVAFSLAVIYDRDEQRAAAFDVLDHMQGSSQGEYARNVANELGRMRFAPAADRHYYQGLLYESQNRYVEARAEWALYAASGNLPWRARALDHIAAIDAVRRAQPVKPAQPGGPPQPPVLHRKIPRP
jgi:tetratricopeptide (TPR) repeat protein